MNTIEKWVAEVLEFWFAELGPKDWFEPNPETDREIAERFGDLHERLRAMEPEHLAAAPDTALAAIIVLDQFGRNMFRKTGRAFSGDQIALAIAHSAMRKGLDAHMTEQQRMFLYMPYMHSENLSDQERSVDLFRALGNENSLKYAIEHRDIIARFGRFPHRNKALGRTSTADERAFLEQHSGYGQ